MECRDAITRFLFVEDPPQEVDLCFHPAIFRRSLRLIGSSDGPGFGARFRGDRFGRSLRLRAVGSGSDEIDGDVAYDGHVAQCGVVRLRVREASSKTGTTWP